MSISNHSTRGKSPTETQDEKTKRKSVLGRLCEVLAVGEQGSGDRKVAGYRGRHDSFLTDKGARGHAAPIETLSTVKTANGDACIWREVRRSRPQCWPNLRAEHVLSLLVCGNCHNYHRDFFAR
jgi:hypothetical protein